VKAKPCLHWQSPGRITSSVADEAPKSARHSRRISTPIQLQLTDLPPDGYFDHTGKALSSLVIPQPGLLHSPPPKPRNPHGIPVEFYPIQLQLTALPPDGYFDHTGKALSSLVISPAGSLHSPPTKARNPHDIPVGFNPDSIATHAFAFRRVF